MALSLKKKFDGLKKERIAQQEVRRLDRLKTWYYLLLAPAAFVAIIYWDAYARPTFIPLSHLLLIGGVAGILLSLPCLKVLREYVLLLMVFIGIVFALLFLMVNQAWADDRPREIIKKPVVKKHPPYKSLDAYIEFRYDGNYEKINVEDDQLEKSNYITLTVKKGCFGYVFIDDYKILAE